MALPRAFADAEKDTVLGIWLVSYYCGDCRGWHHYGGGPLSGPPRAGFRISPCGRRVEVSVRPG